ncbi:MAG: hypothetical protein VKJ04_05820 [Vampirovibrionales bacterium]|nr:hypothetical protein [Vampirovibrionales bacterium]
MPPSTQQQIYSENWAESFHFSQDLAELERYQKLELEAAAERLNVTLQAVSSNEAPERQQPQDTGQEKHYIQQGEPEFLRARPLAPQTDLLRQADSSTAVSQEAQDPLLRQANRLLELEHQLLMLQVENEELRQDNRIMAEQIETLLEEKAFATGKPALAEEATKAAALNVIYPQRRKRFQKIWGNLHLLL